MPSEKSSSTSLYGVEIAIISKAIFVAVAFIWPSALLAGETPPNLQTQIRGLAVTHGFSVKGLEKLGDDPGRPVDGDPRDQLSALLSAFNYVLLADDSGDIDTVMITSRVKLDESRHQGIYVNTTRLGLHHAVRATITGPAGNPQSLMLLLDTGATVIVLPQTMSKTLGFSGDDLRNGWSQTANGKVRTKQGILQSVQVGQAIVKDVAVNFIDDDSLAGIPLLGMSFLSQFRIAIDNKNERLILMAK